MTGSAEYSYTVLFSVAVIARMQIPPAMKYSVDHRTVGLTQKYHGVIFPSSQSQDALKI